MVEWFSLGNSGGGLKVEWFSLGHTGEGLKVECFSLGHTGEGLKVGWFFTLGNHWRGTEGWMIQSRTLW